MNIYILRHASAGLKRVNPILDRKRPLDKDGKRHCLQLANVLNAMNLQFDVVISSPLKRSLQTASLVGTETGYEAKIVQSAALAPDAGFSQFHKLIREFAEFEDVLLVGHNPNLTSFLGMLMIPPAEDRLTLGLEGSSVPVRLRKGSLARLNMTRGPATLQWLLDPRTVRALYATSTVRSLSKTSRK